ncbi:MAG: metallophosphoesterase [Pseudomonadota bacterium]
MRRFLLLLLFAGVAAAFYAYRIEPNRIKVEHVVIPDETLWRAWGETKIVHLSDLHIVHPGKREENLARLVNDLHPDIIVITGDMVQWNKDPADAIDYVTGFQAPLGVYCVLGDSDMATGRQQCIFCHPSGNVHQLREHPQIFKNDFVTVNPAGSDRKITIAGFFDQDMENDSGRQLPIHGLPDPENPLLVLNHFSHGWDKFGGERPLLWLAGDTHGGQVKLPDFLWQRLHIVDYPEYRSGLFSDGGHKWLYVNRGIGTASYFPFRFGATPEITVITFKKGS